jgi:hypothetical protein
LLPYLEEDALARQIDVSASYSSVTTVGGQPIASYRVNPYLCPSEPHDVPRLKDGEPYHYPLNYAINLGTWLVWEPISKKGGEGAFFPESWLRTRSFRDGLSKTLCLAEVQAYSPYERNAGVEGEMEFPKTADDLPAGEAKYGPDLAQNTGHTEWVDGRSHQIGFTTTFTPNKQVSPARVDRRSIDWTNMQEGKSDRIATYAAVTARSHHTGIVNVTMMDGASRAISDDVDAAVWRALSTRRGGDDSTLD